ncbi:hypothetical protein Sa4125_12290 [Aureimonas sp. SA4125]|nr:hypothetical protein Sa4125_12290 [Aureimonas sp. SA4125]
MAVGTGRLTLVPDAASAPAGTIRGYASLFGVVDLVGDRIEPGAFLASLARRGPARIRMLWQHDPARPVGVWTRLREDPTGLLAEGRLALETQGGREAFALIEAGAVDGLSIGFRTKRAVRDRGGGGTRRRLVEIDLWEISVVTFPMQEGARLIDVRAAMPGLATRLRAGARRLRPAPEIAAIGLAARSAQTAPDRLFGAPP